MPLYEYRCEKCYKTFEAFQKIYERPIKICKFCTGKVQRVISAPGIIFKGTGWYVTDYPSGDRKKALEAERNKAEKCTTDSSCPTSS